MSGPTPNRPFRLGRGIGDRLATVRRAPQPESSDIAAKRISEALDTHAVDLDLRNCQLSAIPPEVFEMTWLKSQEADIVVFLVSAALLASDYCNDVEMKRALERQAAGQCRIVPIIVRDAKWQLSKLAGFQALPKNGKPITTWPNQDSAWRNVADGLEHIIKTLSA